MKTSKHQGAMHAEEVGAPIEGRKGYLSPTLTKRELLREVTSGDAPVVSDALVG